MYEGVFRSYLKLPYFEVDEFNKGGGFPSLIYPSLRLWDSSFCSAALLLFCSSALREGGEQSGFWEL